MVVHERGTNVESGVNMESKKFLYKTAYAPLYRQYVGIDKVRTDERGELIFECHLPNDDRTMLFRECELTNFCL